MIELKIDKLLHKSQLRTFVILFSLITQFDPEEFDDPALEAEEFDDQEDAGEEGGAPAED